MNVMIVYQIHYVYTVKEIELVIIVYVDWDTMMTILVYIVRNVITHALHVQNMVVQNV